MTGKQVGKMGQKNVKSKGFTFDDKRSRIIEYIRASTGFDGDDAALEAIRKTVALNFKI